MPLPGAWRRTLAVKGPTHPPFRQLPVRTPAA